MASSKRILAMIRSHAAGDDDRFLSVAETIAHDAEKAGHNRMAGDILTLVEAVREEQRERRPASRPTPIAVPRGELAGLLKAAYSKTLLDDVVLGSDLSQKLARLVREHLERSRLAERGISPRRKILLSGPPGTGKSMTAAALAGELSLPLFTVMLDGVITKYMGETAAKLRLIFDSMTEARGVYFFDEVDALATTRGNENDVGEARRVLNSFLLFLEEDTSSSLIVAATNHGALLDRAIFRRFDAALSYQLPTSGDIKRIISQRLSQFDLSDIDWKKIEAHTKDLSQADMVSAAYDSARAAVLDGEGTITSKQLIQALDDKNQPH